MVEKIAVPHDVYSELYKIFIDISKSHSIYVSKHPLKSNLIFHDEIWGQVEIPWPASVLFVIPMFTRSSGIRQLGATVFQYTGATHTRLAHQIGVAHLMRKAYQNIIKGAGNGLKDLSKNLLEDSVQEFWKPYLEHCSKNKNTNVAELVKNFVNDKVFDEIYDLVLNKLGEVIIVVAGLVHDLGHGGWSHALDGINEVLRENIAKTGLTKSLAALRSPEIKKLDILAGIYLLNTSFQFDILWNAFSEYLEMEKKRLGSSDASGDDGRLLYERIKRLFDSGGRFLLPYIVTAIVSEDRGYLAPLYRNYFSLLLMHYVKEVYSSGSRDGAESGGRNPCIDILSIIAVIELLAVVIEIGIFLLDDINADRLDWVPRDALNLGYQQGHDLRERIKNAIDSWVPACVDVEYDESVKLIKVRLKTKGSNINVSANECNKLIDLRKDIVETRKEFYKHYHSTFKALVDSIVLRMAYSVAIIAEQAVEAGLNLMTVNDALISLISSQDDVFLHCASTVLNGVGRKLLALLEVPQLHIKTFSNVRYAARTSKPPYTFLINLFYPMATTNVESEESSELHRFKMDDYELIVAQIKVGEVLPELSGLYNLIRRDKNRLRTCSEFLNDLMQKIIDLLDLPRVEEELNRELHDREPNIDIYLTGIHYGVKELRETIVGMLQGEDIEGDSRDQGGMGINSKLNSDMSRVLKLPLVFLFIYNFEPNSLNNNKVEEIRKKAIEKLQAVGSIQGIKHYIQKPRNQAEKHQPNHFSRQTVNP